jgi:hypothetical protein
LTQQTQWRMFFQTESELIEAVKDINVQKFNELCNKNICSGYQYITRTSRALKAGDELSDPQLRMVKRLAKQVYKYHKNI